MTIFFLLNFMPRFSDEVTQYRLDRFYNKLYNAQLIKVTFLCQYCLSYWALSVQLLLFDPICLLKSVACYCIFPVCRQICHNNSLRIESLCGEWKQGKIIVLVEGHQNSFLTWNKTLSSQGLNPSEMFVWIVKAEQKWL